MSENRVTHSIASGTASAPPPQTKHD